MDGYSGPVALIGVLLALSGLVILLMGWGGLDERLPTQVPPRRYGRNVVAVGLVLVALAAVAATTSGS